MDTTNDTTYNTPPSSGSMGTDTAAQTAASDKRAIEATADQALADRAARRAEGQDILSRVVKGAHETIDRLADTAAPHVHKLEDTLATANVKAQARAGHARDIGDEWAESLRTTVRENPLAAVAAAVALGVVVAKLTR